MSPSRFSGLWQNEFGSVMKLTEVKSDEGNHDVVRFEGSYTSHTGETGRYYVSGIADAKPTTASQVIGFNILWKNLDASDNNSSRSFNHAMSSFIGQLQYIDGNEVLSTSFMLAENTPSDLNWRSTLFDKSTFRRITKQIYPLTHYGKENNRHIVFELQSGPLTDNGASRWFTELEVGSPPQQLKWMIDTGTTHTWVTSTYCGTQACLDHSRFDKSQSETFRSLNKETQTIDFGPWGAMQAKLGHDIFRLPNKEIMALNFYLAKHYNGKKFAQLNADGGISLPSLLPENIDSSEILPQLRNNLKIAHPIASFYYDKEKKKGCVLFGAIDSNAFDQRTFILCPLIENNQLINMGLSYLWTITLDSVTFRSPLDNVEETSNSSAAPRLISIAFAVDTGSSFFKGGKTVIEKIIKVISNEGRFPIHFSVPGSTPNFSNYPDLEFNIQQQTFTLSPEQYFTELDNGTWRLAFQVLEGLPDNFLLAGTLFLEDIYSVFFYQTRTSTKAIGLAKKIETR